VLDLPPCTVLPFPPAVDLLFPTHPDRVDASESCEIVMMLFILENKLSFILTAQFSLSDDLVVAR
jgi:hypothetical protein